jgi:hypothetical protein
MNLKYKDGVYRKGTEIITMSDIGAHLREGGILFVKNEYDMDVTKQTLVKVAFGKHLYLKQKDGSQFFEDVLSVILTTDALLDIIEEGGIDEFMSRYRRRVR